MLEDYIKHFAGYLGVNPGDQAANSSEENSCHYPDDKSVMRHRRKHWSKKDN